MHYRTMHSSLNSVTLVLIAMIPVPRDNGHRLGIGIKLVSCCARLKSPTPARHLIQALVRGKKVDVCVVLPPWCPLSCPVEEPRKIPLNRPFRLKMAAGALLGTHVLPVGPYQEPKTEIHSPHN